MVRNKQHGARTAGDARRFHYFVLTAFVFVCVFPFYWMYVVASNDSSVISAYPPHVVPGGNLVETIRNVFKVVPFQRALLNSFIVSTLVATSQVFFSTLAGYAFAKLRFAGKRVLFGFILFTMMIPGQLGIVPLYLLMSKLHWVDSLQAVIVPSLVSAFGVFWMRQTITAEIPDELVQAARVDGASVFRIYRSIVMPIIKPTALVLGLFSYLAAWNDFIWPLLVLNSPEHFTVQVAIKQLRAAYFIDYAAQMGGSFLATIPLLLMFVLVARRLVSGVMEGAVKG
jgi:cellobiose transport system permease protein